jgi:hypothetical protein
MRKNATDLQFFCLLTSVTQGRNTNSATEDSMMHNHTQHHLTSRYHRT